MDFWNKCTEKLENRLTQEDFNTWIRPLKGSLVDNTLELVAPNDFILNYVEKNLSTEITGLVKQQSKKDISLVFKTLTKETFVDKYKKNNQNDNSKLVQSYVFDSFVEGKSNHLALAAAKQVASNPKGDYNPLFIYGGVGLGKTHLMHAVGNEILQNSPDKMIDDIQFFAGKEQSQEEFFHTFNALLDRNNQMILTCDKYPKEIDGLEERLKSRLGWGLPVVIDPHELETRAAVLLSKASSMGVELPNDCAIYIAQRIRSNIRELEGALKRVAANSRFTNQPIDLSLVKDALKDLFVISAKMVSIENIQKTVSEYYNIKLSDLLSKRRSRSITRPRQLAMALTKELTNHSLPEIGEAFNGRDHTTVLHACKKITELRKENPSQEEDYRNLTRALTN